MNSIDELGRALNEDLSRGRLLLNLIKSFREFAAADLSESVGDMPAWTSAVALARAADKVRTDLPILSGSLLLYTCGRFEYFVREVVTSLAEDLAASANEYRDLPQSIRNELWNRTLEVSQSAARFGYNQGTAESLILSLADNLRGIKIGERVIIQSSVLSHTESNMNSRMVADLLKRVDVSDVWKTLGKQASLKIHLEARSDGQCTSAAMSRLDGIMTERNRIAHPTPDVTFPDADQVLQTIDFLGVLASNLVEIVLVPR